MSSVLVRTVQRRKKRCEPGGSHLFSDDTVLPGKGGQDPARFLELQHSDDLVSVHLAVFDKAELVI